MTLVQILMGYEECSCSKCGETVLLHPRFAEEWDGLCDSCRNDAEDDAAAANYGDE